MLEQLERPLPVSWARQREQLLKAAGAVAHLHRPHFSDVSRNGSHRAWNALTGL
jgi:hypothetical protein